jgi:hypothetical protein
MIKINRLWVVPCHVRLMTSDSLCGFMRAPGALTWCYNTQCGNQQVRVLQPKEEPLPEISGHRKQPPPTASDLERPAAFERGDVAWDRVIQFIAQAVLPLACGLVRVRTGW